MTCSTQGKELQLQVPIPDAILEAKWYQAWAQGSEAIDKDLRIALMDKLDNFQVQSLLNSSSNIQLRIWSRSCSRIVAALRLRVLSQRVFRTDIAVRILEFVSPRCLEHRRLKDVLRVTLYWSIVAVRMLNDVPAAAHAADVLFWLGSLRRWADTEFASGRWRIHPMVVY